MLLRVDLEKGPDYPQVEDPRVQVKYGPLLEIGLTARIALSKPKALLKATAYKPSLRSWPSTRLEALLLALCHHLEASKPL